MDIELGAKTRIKEWFIFTLNGPRNRKQQIFSRDVSGRRHYDGRTGYRRDQTHSSESFPVSRFRRFRSQRSLAPNGASERTAGKPEKQVFEEFCINMSWKQ